MFEPKTTLLLDVEADRTTLITQAQMYAYASYAQGLKFKMTFIRPMGARRPVVDPEPIVLPYGLWERAEARHRGDTPVKKILSREDREAVRSILWARYWGKEAVRKNWYARNGLVIPDA